MEIGSLSRVAIWATLIGVGLAALLVALRLSQAAEFRWAELRIDDPEAQIDQRDWNLHNKGGEVLCVKKGDPTVVPRIVRGDNGSNALRIELGPTTGPGPDHGRDKINFRVLKGSEPTAPAFGGGMVYFGFAVELDRKDFQAPTTGAGYLIAQWWQGAPFGPPLALDILATARATDDPPIAFEIRNTNTGGSPGSSFIEVRPNVIKSLRRGEWYHFIVGTKFGLHNDGQLKVWINGSSTPEIDWKGSIGYDPSLTAASLGYKTGSELDHHPNGRIELYIGPYRDRMESTQVFYYAHVAYGPTAESVR